jgi:hypothetical protein
VSATVDREQLAALRTLRRGFGDVQVLEVLDLAPGRDPAPVQASQGELFEEVTSGLTSRPPVGASGGVVPGWVSVPAAVTLPPGTTTPTKERRTARSC